MLLTGLEVWMQKARCGRCSELMPLKCRLAKISRLSRGRAILGKIQALIREATDREALVFHELSK